MAQKTKLARKREEFRAKLAELGRIDRDERAARDAAQRRLAQLQGQRREREVEAHLAGLPGGDGTAADPNAIEQLEAEIAEAEAAVERDPWGPKIEACRRAREQLLSEQEAFLRDNCEALLADLVAADLAATEDLEAAFAHVHRVAQERDDVGREMDEVLRFLPPPHDGSSYRLQVRHDRATEGLIAEIARRNEGLAPLAPVELFVSEAGD